MRAMQIIEWGQPLEARDYPDPEPQGEEVLLRVEAAGVCHSDVHIWDGHFDLGGGQQISLASRGVQLPFTMGHEIAGEVVALGPQASGVKIGDKVVAYPWIGCGQCAVCQKGEELLCLRPRTLGTRVAGEVLRLPVGVIAAGFRCDLGQFVRRVTDTKFVEQQHQIGGIGIRELSTHVLPGRLVVQFFHAEPGP